MLVRLLSLSFVTMLLACSSGSSSEDTGRDVNLCEPSSAYAATQPECPVRFGDSCFDTIEKACACAGCEEQRCEIQDSVPPRASCSP